MPRNIESDIYIEPKKHLDLPWYSLKPYPEGGKNIEILKANVRPLLLDEMKGLTSSLIGHDPRRLNLLKKLHDINTELLHSSSTLAIVLDGRSYEGSTEGFLGDMIEASRLVRPFREAGKEIIIATFTPDLFQGNNDSGINILPIPENVWSTHTPPWRKGFLSYLHDHIGNMPIVFPMNANMPAFIRLGKGGEVINDSVLTLVGDTYRPFATKKYMTSVVWGKNGVHQLQALQIVARDLGIEASNWEKFPDAFLYPIDKAKEVAKEVILVYGCFHCEYDCPPLFLHPGTATGGSKLLTKFYPENKWAEAIRLLANTPNTARSITFLEPTNQEQKEMTLRLATVAVESGLHVAKVPMASIKDRFDWTLGSFIAFLQELAKAKGVVVGCDSMPAGHAGPATGNPALVLGSIPYNPGFFCPPSRALVVMPTENPYTSSIKPSLIAEAFQHLCFDPEFK